MKAWKKTVALLMALGMTFSIVACGDTESSSGSSTGSTGSTGGNGGGETTVPTTTDEIFAYVMDAMDATKSHTGSVTMAAEGGYTNESKEGEEVREDASEQMYIVSYDSVNKVRYMEEVEEDEYGSSVYYCKTFAQGNNFYGVEKGTYTPPADSMEEAESGEDYFQLVGEVKEEMQAFNVADEIGEVFEMYDGVKLADSVSELKTALETAIPVLMVDEMPEGVTPTVTVTTTTASENSVYTFTFAFEVSFEAEEDGQIMEGGLGMTCSASAKDGKIVDLDITSSMLYAVAEMDGTEKTVLMSQSSTSEQRATIEYTFAQAKYDALTVELPTNPDDIYVEGAPAEDYEEVKTNVYVNGVSTDTVDYYGVETPEAAFERIISKASVSLDRAEVKAYKDAAFTQELTEATLTKADVLALEEVYLKVTPKTGFALIREGWSQREEYSKTYQMVLPIVASIFGGGVHMEAHAYFRTQEAGEFALNETAVLDPSCEIWINGEKMTTKTETITVESGQTYQIEYVRVTTDPVVAEAE